MRFALLSDWCDSPTETDPPAGRINADTKVAGLVDQYLDRLEEDGRSRVTMMTYRFTTTTLKKSIGGLQVGESSPTRVDVALRSMRNAHGATMARQSKNILRGALQLAVMASVRGPGPLPTNHGRPG